MEYSSQALWTEKYQPRKLESLTFSPEKTALLSSLAENSDFPHLIFYGPEGAGKKTRMHCFLSKVYGEGIYRMSTMTKDYKGKNKNFSYMVNSSNYHLEFCPSDLGINDKWIISKVIKETANFTQLDPNTQKSFKVIVLLEADKMTKDAQSALRRTMEKYSENARIIMICNDLGGIIDPIRSRCFALRIPAPSKEEIKDCLINIKKKENLEISDSLIDKMIIEKGRNTRECITCMQLTSLGNFNDRFFEPEFLEKFKSIIRTINKDKSAKGILSIRQDSYDLLLQGFPGTEIIYRLMIELCKDKSISEDAKVKIIEASKKFDSRVIGGAKDVIHLEGFVSQVMLILFKDSKSH